MGCVCDGLRKIEPKEDYIEQPPVFTKGEISVLRNNWQDLQIHLANVGVNTFISLFESEPEIQETFSEFKGKQIEELKLAELLRKHSLRVMATLDKCILHLDDQAFIIPSLTDLGIVHAKSKVTIHYLELILPNFLNAIKPYMQEHWCLNLEEAWSKVFQWMIFYIREGMMKYANR